MRLLLEKTHGKPVGTISTHGGVKVKKVAPGKWRPVGKEKQLVVKESVEPVKPKDLKEGDVLELKLTTKARYGTSMGAGDRPAGTKKVTVVALVPKQGKVVVRDSKKNNRGWRPAYSYFGSVLSGEKRDYNVESSKVIDKKVVKDGLIVKEAGTTYAGGGWEKQLEVREIEMSKLNHERCYGFDHQGNEVFHKDGQKHMIQFSPSEAQKMKGLMVFTHNHPGVGGPFSPEDISMLQTTGISEMRAVGRYATYTASFKPKMTNLEYFGFVATLADVHADLQDIFGKKIREGKLTTKSANLAHWHEVWIRMSVEYPSFKYQKLDRG